MAKHRTLKIAKHHTITEDEIQETTWWKLPNRYPWVELTLENQLAREGCPRATHC